MFVVYYKGIDNRILRTVKFKVKPSWTKLNTIANKIALEYGSHPSYQVVEIK